MPLAARIDRGRLQTSDRIYTIDVSESIGIDMRLDDVAKRDKRGIQG